MGIAVRLWWAGGVSLTEWVFYHEDRKGHEENLIASPSREFFHHGGTEMAEVHGGEPPLPLRSGNPVALDQSIQSLL